MSRKTLTRRQWAAAVAAAPAAAAAVAPPQAPATTADLLAEAKQAAARHREALSKFKIERPLEPAVRFEA
jgi:hypothetical protein